MALATATLKARIARQLGILGLDNSVNEEATADVLRDAVRAFVAKMDEPVISATMAVTADDDGPYSVPATIRKVQDIRDADGDSVVYSKDVTARTVTLQDAPSASGNYTVYGTPKEVATNLDTIIAAISEDHEAVLAAYCVAYGKLYVMAEGAEKSLQAAVYLAQQERKSRNRDLDMDYTTVKHKDVRGQLVSDSSNAEGLDVDIDDDLASDL